MKNATRGASGGDQLNYPLQNQKGQVPQKKKKINKSKGTIILARCFGLGVGTIGKGMQ